MENEKWTSQKDMRGEGQAHGMNFTSQMAGLNPPPFQLTASGVSDAGFGAARQPSMGVVQRARHDIFTDYTGSTFSYDDVAKCLLDGGEPIAYGVNSIAEARKSVLKISKVGTNNSQPQGAMMDLEGNEVAEMLALDDEGEVEVLEDEFGDVEASYDGATVVDTITGGGSVSSAGASTCVIVVMAVTLGDQEVAACKHFTAGTEHFDNPAPQVDEMYFALRDQLNVQMIPPANIRVYAVGGKENDPEAGDMTKDFLALRQVLNGFNLVEFNVPATDANVHPSGLVNAMYSAAGFQWQRG